MCDKINKFKYLEYLKLFIDLQILAMYRSLCAVVDNTMSLIISRWGAMQPQLALQASVGSQNRGAQAQVGKILS